jgi:endonuclease/exonuclease/phosphatase family metal-dependent hydrolase
MRVLSWNIQWGRGADGMVDLQRCIDTIRVLGDFDVICLQEVAQGFASINNGRAVDGPAVLAAAFPGYSAHFGAAFDGPDGVGGRNRFGNLTLSRLPVGMVRVHSLPLPPEAGHASMPRVCVEVVVADRLRILNTHLEYYGETRRLAQAEALRTLQQETGLTLRMPGESTGRNRNGTPFEPLARPESALLCGDFNCEPGSPALAALTARDVHGMPVWVDAWQACYGMVPHLHTVGVNGAEWPDRPYCCDFIWVTPDLLGKVESLVVDQATAASDHQPLLLSLSLEP